MKKIGLLGGMSWESTSHYYDAINKRTKEILGGFHSAEIILYSVDFEVIEKLQSIGDWDGQASILKEAAKIIELAGADFLVVCSNTMHKVASEIERAIKIPLLHIVDATAEQLLIDGIDKIGLIGTSFTMKEDFYKKKLENNYGIAVIVPNHSDQKKINNVIYNELCQGIVDDNSREDYLNIIEKLAVNGAQAVVLGCTEIGMLISSEDANVPLYDTTLIHSRCAVDYALASSGMRNETKHI